MTGTVTITDPSDVREGDWVVLTEPRYGRFEGEAKHSGSFQELMVAGWYVKGGQATFIEARRPKPSLPTSLSLIRADIEDGPATGGTFVLVGPDLDGDWRIAAEAGYFTPDRIVDFEVLWTEDESE